MRVFEKTDFMYYAYSIKNARFPRVLFYVEELHVWKGIK